MQIIKRPLRRIAKKYPAARKARHFYVVQRNKVLRQVHRLYKVEDKKVIFEAYNGRSYACSPRAIYEEMLQDERFADYEFIWAFRKPKKYKRLLKNPRTTLVKYRSPRYYRTYARAKYWITNTMIPLQVTKKPAQVLLQCWHGTPLKRLRNDIIENTKNAMNSLEDFVRKNKADTARYDYMISPSKFASEKFTSAFGLKELGKQDILIETGYPRNDFLFTYTQKDVDTAKNKLNLPRDNRKILLYAPTWRDDQHTAEDGYIYESPVDFDYLQKELSSEYIILFRAHYMVADKFDFKKYEGFVYNASKVDDVNDLYIISDALITDYSSVFFDFANLRRPIHFFMYDKKYYKEELRGFYLDLAELPGKIVETEKDLVADIRCGKMSDNYDAFCNKFTYLDDDNAAGRVIERIYL
ncbi:MAG: CDP-glycerol glycerophosphotransferase family protein [Candidatus Saccharimonadales bacterium]